MINIKKNRRALSPQIYPSDHNKQNILKKLYNRPNILALIRNKQLKGFGHTWRADGLLIKKVLVEKINKTRPLGRPRIQWINVISRDLREIGQNVTFELTYNRDRWRDLLKSVMVLNGPVG
ncbi:Reverse transcriptase domain-containing protein [Aphis craccivora]|uniref:Reverse transcriptase domain-containing protein n=1 Tax=Aphis craccivora TaxID=307492 RepID=A0A6G0ZEY1_APHCR|nr:Reverse transcriptase domain-containing protein [Aphis craccivora]